MAICPKCGGTLEIRKQVLNFHDITCPSCSSKLEVQTSSKLTGIIIGVSFPVFMVCYFYNSTLGPVYSLHLFCCVASFFGIVL